MQIKKYRVRNLSEGLEQIKRELGRDAVIVSTSRVPDNGTGETLEVTVASGPAAQAPKTTTAPEAAPAAPPPSPGLQGALTKLMAHLADLQSEMRHLRLDRAQRPSVTGVETSSPRCAPTSLPSSTAFPLALLHNDDGPEHLTRAFALQYETLVRGGVLPGHTETVLAEAFSRLDGKARSPRALFLEVERAIARRLETETPLWKIPPGDRRQVAVFMGPTGVGKTSTIAKIAGRAAVVGGRRVGLIGADTYRIGGLYQLETYADLIGLPLRTAGNPRELRRALDDLVDCDLVLIDTTGRSPWNESPDDGLTERDWRTACEDDELLLHLCSSAGGRTEDGVRLLEHLLPFSPYALISTKLDETSGLGGLLSLSMSSGLPIAAVTNGPNVPDDIAAPSTRELARWIRSGLFADEPRSARRNAPLTPESDSAADDNAAALTQATGTTG